MRRDLGSPDTTQQLDQLIVHQRGALDAAAASLRDMEGVHLLTEQHIIPRAREAISAAYDVATTNGEFTPRDTSMAYSGTALSKRLGEYAAPFALASPFEKDRPALGLVLTPVVVEAGRQRYLEPSPSKWSIAKFGTTEYRYATHIRLPVLVDPEVYGLDSYASLPDEQTDGFAAQVRDGWQLIKEQHPNDPTYNLPPRVVRAIGVLPVAQATDGPLGYDFCFSPTVTKGLDDGPNRRYDVQLLVRGESNRGGRRLNNFTNTDYVLMDADGREAPFRVSRGEAVPNGDMPSSLTARSQGAIAIYLTPRTRVLIPPYFPQQSSAERSTFPLDGPISKGLGGASITAGGATWSSVGDRNYGGEQIKPAEDGVPPTIYVLQLFTV